MPRPARDDEVDQGSRTDLGIEGVQKCKYIADINLTISAQACLHFDLNRRASLKISRANKSKDLWSFDDTLDVANKKNNTAIYKDIERQRCCVIFQSHID